MATDTPGRQVSDPTAQDGTERRTAPRYPVLVRGTMDTVSGPVAVQTTNIGANGVGVSADTALLVGDTVRLQLFPDSGQDDPIAVLGRVAWCEEHVEVGYFVGIQITTLDPQAESRWHRWLKTLEHQ